MTDDQNKLEQIVIRRINALIDPSANISLCLSSMSQFNGGWFYDYGADDSLAIEHS